MDLSVLIEPPAVDFTDPMDAALNLGNILKSNSNSYRGGKIISSGIYPYTLDAIVRALEFMMKVSTDLILDLFSLS